MHYFNNFKGFAKAKLDLFKPITVLIGPNGSGKSNVIEGIELLAFIAHGRPLYEIVDVGRGGGGMEIRGGLQSCPRHNSDHFILGFHAFIEFLGKTSSFDYYIEVEVRPKPRILDEELSFSDGPMIFKATGRGRSPTPGDIEVEYNNFARGGHKPKISVSSNYSVLSQYKEFAIKNTRYKACISLIEGVKNYLRSSFVFDPNPKLMRNYERIGNNILSRDGSNLSAVLYGLEQGDNEEKEALHRLLNLIKQLPEEPYQNLSFFKTPLNDVIFGLQEANGGPLVDARLLSDGTLRCLAVLTALETVEENSRVVIEEFDNGLHPNRVHILIQAIESCCKRRNLNVLVTTHNPATLNALQIEQLDGVVLCAWDSEQQAFKLVKLYDLPRSDELLERGRLGDLITRRVIEQYLTPKFEEIHKNKALEWLQNLL